MVSQVCTSCLPWLARAAEKARAWLRQPGLRTEKCRPRCFSAIVLVVVMEGCGIPALVALHAWHEGALIFLVAVYCRSGVGSAGARRTSRRA